MRAKPSPLQLLDFALTGMEFKVITPKKLEENPAAYFSEYEVDIDFGISRDDFLKVYMKALINRGGKQLPGYSLTAEATCIFRFEGSEQFSQDVRNNLEGYSTIYIALNGLRGLISNFTANAPFGRYMLPSIDLNDLIQKKKAILKTDIEKKTAKKRIAAKK